ncbi:MAG: flagellar basal-body rod protein FlgF [Alphaproteobacteria bacterium]|nr:flagellar basal-body rod protein FlgF [Alphaproteobacteria bacterium]
MMSPSLVLLSDQMALERATDIVANNVANSSTTGFKREGIQFNTLLSNLMSGKSTAFVIDKSTYRDTSPGTIVNTGNPLDLALQDKGYFEVQGANGQTEYTRDGAFRTDNQGQIVTSSGMPVLSDGGAPITLPDDARDISISGDGFLTAQVGTGSARAQLGKIGVVTFDSEEQMKPQGNGLFTTAQNPTAATGNIVMQGAVEQSNVKPITEMTNLIRIQRSYEQACNLVGQENTRLTDAINKLSQVT